MTDIIARETARMREILLSLFAYFNSSASSLDDATLMEPSDLQVRAHELCSEHLGGVWSNVEPSDLVIKPITGGASNLIYHCTLPDNKKPAKGSGEPAEILLRFYGDQSSDVTKQCEIFDLLSKKGLGPKLYGIFEGGRLEEFLPANSLTSDEIRDKEISKIIAKHLAVVHQLNAPIDKDESWLIEGLNEWYESMCNITARKPSGDITSSQSSPSSSSPKSSCSISKDGLSQGCQANRKIIIENCSNSFHSDATRLIANELANVDFRKEIDFIKSEIFDKSTSPKVFSHNDLHQGNILYVEKSKRRPSLEERIVFIDFEYCSYNYRAYDIANHLCEWLFQYGTNEYPYFECFQERFPNKSEQLTFISHYLSEKQRIVINNININDDDYDGSNKKLPILNIKTGKMGSILGTSSSSSPSSADNNANLTTQQPLNCITNDDDNQIKKNNNNNYNDNINMNFNNTDDENEMSEGPLKTSLAKNNQPIADMQTPVTDIQSNGDINCHHDAADDLNMIDQKNTNGIKHSQEELANDILQQLNADSCKSIESSSNPIDTSDVSVDPRRVLQLYNEVQPFFMAVSLFWTIWCIKQALTSNINFGYWEHAMARWKLYSQFKSSHLKSNHSVKFSNIDINENKYNNNNYNNDQDYSDIVHPSETQQLTSTPAPSETSSTKLTTTDQKED